MVETCSQSIIYNELVVFDGNCSYFYNQSVFHHFCGHDSNIPFHSNQKVRFFKETSFLFSLFIIVAETSRRDVELIFHCCLLSRGRNVLYALYRSTQHAQAGSKHVCLSGIWFIIGVNTFVLFAVSLRGYLTDGWLLMWPINDGFVV